MFLNWNCTWMFNECSKVNLLSCQTSHEHCCNRRVPAMESRDRAIDRCRTSALDILLTTHLSFDVLQPCHGSHLHMAGKSRS
jgi:hypothetical protein